MKTDLGTIIDQRRIYSHILFAILSLVIVATTALTRYQSFSYRDQVHFFVLLMCYLETFIFLARRIFRRIDPETTGKKFLKEIVTGFLIFYIACFFSALFIYILFRYLNYLINGLEVKGMLYNFFHSEFKTWFKSTISGLSLGAVIFLVIQWMDALKRERKLKEQNLIFYNETLKNQVNPHFLFNNLNTLSSLMNTDPEAAEKFLNRLSSIYRYILENSQNSKVPLNSELSFIKDYFDLYRIRDEGKISLSVDAPGKDRFFIIPVSLQILIENAIKHNMATREKPLNIEIYIDDQNIIVKNNLQKMSSPLKSTRIGLKNLAERVNLLTGKALIIEETNSDFIVKVPLFS